MCRVMYTLSGLEPSEVRYAQEEFKKFDMENSGKLLMIAGIVTKLVLRPISMAISFKMVHHI